MGPLGKWCLTKGKARGRVFLVIERHFGRTRVTRLSIFEDDGHTRRENEHKLIQRGRTFALLLHMCG